MSAITEWLRRNWWRQLLAFACYWWALDVLPAMTFVQFLGGVLLIWIGRDIQHSGAKP